MLSSFWDLSILPGSFSLFSLFWSPVDEDFFY